MRYYLFYKRVRQYQEDSEWYRIEVPAHIFIGTQNEQKKYIKTHYEPDFYDQKTFGDLVDLKISLKDPNKKGGKLIILRGLPGAGKSTFAEFLSKSLPSCVYYEADMFFEQDGEYKFDPMTLPSAHEWCYNKVKEAVEVYNYAVVIVSNTNTTHREFAKYEVLAKENAYDVVHLIVENRHGNESVRIEDKNEKVNILDRMRQRFEIVL